MGLRQVELSKLWGLSAARISQMVKAGMPLVSVADAEAWRMANCGWRGGVANTSPSSDAGGLEALPPEPAAPAGERLERADLRGVEARVVEAELQAWRDLYRARAAKDPDREAVIALAKVYREAVATRMSAERALVDIRVRDGVLVTAEASRSAIRDALEPVVRMARNLPASVAAACNPDNAAMARAALEEWVVRLMKLARGALDR